MLIQFLDFMLAKVRAASVHYCTGIDHSRTLEAVLFLSVLNVTLFAIRFRPEDLPVSLRSPLVRLTPSCKPWRSLGPQNVMLDPENTSVFVGRSATACIRLTQI